MFWGHSSLFPYSKLFFQIIHGLLYLNFNLNQMLLPPTIPVGLLHNRLYFSKNLEGAWARGLRKSMGSRDFKFHTQAACLHNFHPFFSPIYLLPCPLTFRFMTSSQIINVACTYVYINAIQGVHLVLLICILFRAGTGHLPGC